MIRATGTGRGLRTLFTNGHESAMADTRRQMGGGEEGFRPFELLEAALSTCITMTVLYYAQRHQIPLESASVKAAVDHADPHGMRFEYSVRLEGDLTDRQRSRLLRAAAACPVHRMLEHPSRFEDVTAREES